MEYKLCASSLSDNSRISESKLWNYWSDMQIEIQLARTKTIDLACRAL